MTKRLIATKAVITIGGKEFICDNVYITEPSRIPETTLEREEYGGSFQVELTRTAAPFNYEDDDLSDEESLEYSDCQD